MTAYIESSNRFQVLCYDQVNRLDEVMTATIPIHGRGNFPTLDVNLNHFIRVVRDRLVKDGVKIHDIRLNGGAASYILGAGVSNRANKTSKENKTATATPSKATRTNVVTTDTGKANEEFMYNDLDLIFGVDINGAGDFERVKDIVLVLKNSNGIIIALKQIKQSVLKSLLTILPDEVNKSRMNTCNLKEAYVQKMVKIYNNDNKWSLISLANNFGRNVEFKFVDCMKRQFEFSVDSFQIKLDSLLGYYDTQGEKVINSVSYPTIVGESVYGDIEVALKHLHLREIATRNPEQIRGGGLFKYCSLLIRGYTMAKDMNQKTLEKYMCSRFFIDFPDINVQQNKLHQYLVNHIVDLNLMHQYLQKLYSIIDESTVCLMGHERRQTLQVIQLLANQVLAEIEYNAYVTQFQQQLSNQNTIEAGTDVTMYADRCNLIIDQIFYGSECAMPPYVLPAQVAL